jgi:hypothetical protein
MHPRADLMTENGDKSPFDKLSRKSAIVLALFSSPFFFLFLYLGDPAKGRAASICVFVIISVAWLSSELRKRVWYWVTITVLVVLHIPLILLVPWTNKDYPGVVLLPFALLDFVLVYGCFKLAENLMKWTRTHLS